MLPKSPTTTQTMTRRSKTLVAKKSSNACRGKWPEQGGASRQERLRHLELVRGAQGTVKPLAYRLALILPPFNEWRR